MSVADTSRTGSAVRRGGYLAGAVLLGLFVFHAVNNWLWAATNVTLMGWDRSSHLAKTLIYNDILRQIDLRTVFTALTWPWNRPPLPFLSVVSFYRLFGTSTDVALMSNCLFLGVLLGSVYGIGRMLYGRRAGLLAAFLVSFYPVLFSISRLSYVDYALTAMVALSVYLLLKTDGFRNRRWSLAFGLSVGLGLLTKWPFIAFAGAPIAYMAWRSGALKRVLFVPWGGSEGSTGRSRVLTSPWFHALAALVVSALWYVPNWDRLSGFLLGYWLPGLSWVLLASTFYILSRKPSQATNLLSAGMIGATLASAWSLPNLGFSSRFVFVAYGGVNIQGKDLSFLDPTFYARYLSMMLTEQLSPLYFTALVAAVAVMLLAALRRRSPLAAWRKMSEGTWILGLWFVVPFLVFTLSQTWNSRFDIALLPAAALLTTRGLLDIRASRARIGLVSLLVICGVAQFLVLSYDSLYWISQRTIVGLPVVGNLNLLGEGAYIMPPNTGRTDSRYWAAPQILSAISDESDGAKALGLLVNNTHLNADILRYLSLLEFEEVEIWDLARDEDGPPAYVRLFAADYVMVSTHDPYKLSDGAKEAVQKIVESPDVFGRVFGLAAQYEFPDGEIVSLYRKSLPAADQAVQDYYRHLEAALGPTLTEGSAIILDPSEQVATFAQFYDGTSPVYLPSTGDSAEVARILEEVAEGHQRVHAIFRTEGETDAEHLVESWLSEHAYRARDEWFGDVRLALFATAGRGVVPPEEHEAYADLGGESILLGWELPDGVIQPGQILRTTLLWRAQLGLTDDYVVFVQLLDEEGRLVAQHDGHPAGGLRPTTTWLEDEIVADNHGLLIPDGTVPGVYELVAGMYLPSTGERLPVLNGAGDSEEESLLLGLIQVAPPETGVGVDQNG